MSGDGIKTCRRDIESLASLAEQMRAAELTGPGRTRGASRSQGRCQSGAARVRRGAWCYRQVRRAGTIMQIHAATHRGPHRNRPATHTRQVVSAQPTVQVADAEGGGVARQPLNLAELLDDPPRQDAQLRPIGDAGKGAHASDTAHEASVGAFPVWVVIAIVTVIGLGGAGGYLWIIEPGVRQETRAAVPDRLPATADSVTKEVVAQEVKTPAGEALPRRGDAALGPPTKVTDQTDRDPSGFSPPIQELMRYLDGLKKGRFAFNVAMSGEDAAKELKFTRLFASAYEEMLLRVKSQRAAAGAVSIGDVISTFEGIVREEQQVDRLMLATDQAHTASIAYLRALQNGDVAFPGPSDLAPIAAVLLVQLVEAYPNTTFDVTDAKFAEVYRRTREFADQRMADATEVQSAEIISEFRRRIVASATGPR